MGDVEFSVESGVARLTLNRPKVMNALAMTTIRELRTILRDVQSRGEARALLITGAGRAFCTGADLSDPEISLDGRLEDRAAKLAVLMHNEINPLVAEFHALPIPKIAAVNGAAVGAGVGLALAADIVLAGRSAYFTQVFTPRLGLVPDMGTTWHMPRLIGRARALGSAMLGEKIDAVRAESWGMIWKVIDDDALQAEAMRLAAQFAAGPTSAFAALSRCIDASYENDLQAQLEVEAEAQCSLVSSVDAQEAVQAFRDKRAPAFRGK